MDFYMNFYVDFFIKSLVANFKCISVQIPM